MKEALLMVSVVLGASSAWAETEAGRQPEGAVIGEPLPGGRASAGQPKCHHEHRGESEHRLSAEENR